PHGLIRRQTRVNRTSPQRHFSAGRSRKLKRCSSRPFVALTRRQHLSPHGQHATQASGCTHHCHQQSRTKQLSSTAKVPPGFILPPQHCAFTNATTTPTWR